MGKEVQSVMPLSTMFPQFILNSKVEVNQVIFQAALIKSKPGQAEVSLKDFLELREAEGSCG